VDGRVSMADLGSEVTRGVPGVGFCRWRRFGFAQDGPRTEGGTPALRDPSPYEVDDFQVVALDQIGFRPLVSRNDVAV